jgi:RNA polymerase sigma factor (sigma-70 family)
MTRLHRNTSPIALRLNDVIRSSESDDLPDVDLLKRFVHDSDHSAFEVLLRRHGPLVFGVCRRMLSNAADVEDAFQATFLILVRKAGEINRGDRLGPWLYGVACRVALKARCRVAQLAKRRFELTDMIPDLTPPAEVPDWMPILDAELSALPAKYREPLVLCELQGTARADAAKVLKIPEGTLSSRLARGRALLRKKLQKYDVSLPACGLTAMFASNATAQPGVPGDLLARTSELAAILAKGASAAGVVPAASVRLMDEVIRSMFLSQLRTAGATVLAVGLIAVGLMAASPTEPSGESGQENPVAKANAEPASPQVAAKQTPAAKVRPDREAMQGLWLVTRNDMSKQTEKKENAIQRPSLGKQHILIDGDLWRVWFDTGPGGPQMMLPSSLIVKLEPGKNPKWLDLGGPHDSIKGTTRAIYELEGDKLRICFGNPGKSQRPAEFQIDDESDMMVMHLEREKMPPPSADKSLIGSWCDAKLQILDGFIFAMVPNAGGEDRWIGGRYTVDATKNPKWIDVELIAPYLNAKTTRLYGTYEAIHGRLKLALGLSGNRSFRPLELNADKDVLFFDGYEKIYAGMVLPFSPSLLHIPHYFATEPPASKDRDRDELEHIHALIKEGKFEGAAKYIRDTLGTVKGSELSLRKLLLCVCLIQQANTSTDGREERAEALLLARQAIKEIVAEGSQSERATWVKRQAQLRVLQIHQLSGNWKELLKEADSLQETYRGTVEELIALSFMFHAFKGIGDATKALDTRISMKEVFDRLPAKAFTAEGGEYSRDYWKKIWFADQPAKKP